MVKTVNSLVLFPNAEKSVFFLSFGFFIRASHQIIVLTCTRMDRTNIKSDAKYLVRNSYSCVDDWRWSNVTQMAFHGMRKQENKYACEIFINSSRSVCACILLQLSRVNGTKN